MKVNIYSIDMFDNYTYEFSTITELNCSQTVLVVATNKGLLNKIDKHKRNYVWFNKLVNWKGFKATNIVGLKASYK